MLHATIFLIFVVLLVYLLGRLEDSSSFKNGFNAVVWSVETVDGITMLTVVKDHTKIKTYKSLYIERFDHLNHGDEVFIQDGKEYTIYHYLTKQTFTFYDANS